MKLKHYLKIGVKFILFLGFINYLYNHMAMKLNRIKFCGKLKINGRVKVINKGCITFGDNILINSGCNYNIIGGDTRTNFIVRENGEIYLGDNVGISNSTFVSTNSIYIEDDVLIGGGCRFYDTDFHSIDYLSRIGPFKSDIPDKNVAKKEILVKKGAWIGGGCIILKGVTIGRFSIVGAGSVVAKSIPDNEVWGGNPAKFIKKVIT